MMDGGAGRSRAKENVTAGSKAIKKVKVRKTDEVNI